MSSVPRRVAARPLIAAGAAAIVLAGAALALVAAAPAGARAKGTVNVLYAGSLTEIMEQQVGPAFQRATGYRFAGVAAGAMALAQEIAGGQQRADVFISAAPKPDLVLMDNPAHGAIAWYASFARSPLVIGYNPKSRFAAALRRGPWYRVMAESGFHLGRTDPLLDPKGQLTIQFVDAAAKYYHQPDLVKSVLGAVENPSQVYPEQTLVARLQTGQLDAGFFYRNEAVAAHFPYITPPAALAMGARFTVALPAGGANAAGAVAFVRFLLGPKGRAILAKSGLILQKPAVVAAVPAALRPILYPSS